MLNGSFYLVADSDHQAQPWVAAEATCNKAGGTLANPIAMDTGPHELYLIAKLLEGHDLHVAWVGGHRNGPSSVNLGPVQLSDILAAQDGYYTERRKKEEEEEEDRERGK